MLAFRSKREKGCTRCSKSLDCNMLQQLHTLNFSDVYICQQQRYLLEALRACSCMARRLTMECWTFLKRCGSAASRPRSHQNCQYFSIDMTLAPRLIFNPKTRISVQEAPFEILLFMFRALDSLGVPYVSLAKTRRRLRILCWLTSVTKSSRPLRLS